MAKINLNPSLVNKRFRPLLNTTQRYVVVFGGSSSSKSYSIFSMAPAWLLQGRSILGIRENATNVRKSIYLEVTKAIYRQNLEKYFTINKTDMSIICKVSQGSMLMTGVKDVETLKSVTPYKASVFDMIIIEEATEIKDEDTFNQILLRQRGDTRFHKQVYLLFNPINITHWIYNRFFAPIADEYDFNQGRECLYYEDKDLLIHKSTYVDNAYVGEEEIKTFNDMAERSPSMWRIYSQGDFGVMGKLVYDDNIDYVSSFENIQGLPWRLGIDHGFNDYQTFVISKYDSKNNIIYLIDTMQIRKATPLTIANKMKELLVKHRINTGHPIYADSNDSTKNELLKQYGLNIRKVKKGGGSKMTGIMWLKGNRIKVLDTLTDIKNSFNTYVWKKKNGVVLDDTEHTGSDLLDALRYSYELDAMNNLTLFGKHIQY